MKMPSGMPKWAPCTLRTLRRQAALLTKSIAEQHPFPQDQGTHPLGPHINFQHWQRTVSLSSGLSSKVARNAPSLLPCTPGRSAWMRISNSTQ
jgi:hypothetical protein